jgi:hypothetical protein
MMCNQAMRLEELLLTLADRGMRLSTDGERLIFESPHPVLDDQLVTALQHHRPRFLRLLPLRQRAAA